MISSKSVTVYMKLRTFPMDIDDDSDDDFIDF